MGRIEATPITTEDELAFVVFCIENLALKYRKDGALVYAALKDKGDLLHRYIVPGYDFLHTQDKDYILEDIEGVMREQGISL